MSAVSVAGAKNKQENAHIQMFLHQANIAAHLKPTLAVLRKAVLMTFHDSSNAAYQWHFDFAPEQYREYYGILPVGEMYSHRTESGNIGDINAISDELVTINSGYLRSFLESSQFSAMKFSYIKPYKLMNALDGAVSQSYLTAAGLTGNPNDSAIQVTLNQATQVAALKFTARY